MMQDYQEAMLKSLVAVAWADGHVDDQEAEVIEALLAAFEIDGEDAEQIREFAKSPRTLEEIPITELNSSDRRQLLQHAVILSFVDGEQSDTERAVLAQLIERLRLPKEEADEIMNSAAARAKRLLELS